MNIIITEWALQSYVDLKRQNVFTRDDYKKTLRPDVELLKNGIPSPHAKFGQANFWSPAVGLGGVVLKDGFKMKWHNILADFNPLKGNLLSIGMLFLLLCPAIVFYIH